MAWTTIPGLYQVDITPEDGLWTVVDSLPSNYPPDYPGVVPKEDPRRVLVKFWRALRSAKTGRYIGAGHHAALPAHDGRTELVHVTQGHFFCNSRGRKVWLGVGRDPQSEHIQHDADEPRCWTLEDDHNPSNAAEGITLCFSPRLGQTRSGNKGFELYAGSFFSPHCLRKPRDLPQWQWLHVLIFAGALTVYGGGSELTFRKSQAIFLSRTAHQSCTLAVNQTTPPAMATLYF